MMSATQTKSTTSSAHRPITHDPAVARYGIDCLRIIALGFIFYAWGMVISQSLNGAGDTWSPTWLNLLCFWVVELPLAWVLAGQMGMGPRGVFVAVAVAFSMLAVASALVFRRGAWKTRRV